MSSIAVTASATGTGTVSLVAPVTNSDRTVTLPDATTTIVGTDATQTLTNKSIAVTQLTGTLPVANGGTGATSVSGTYTPTLTGVTNIQGLTAFVCQYVQLGNVVTVSGQINIDPTSTGDTVFGISLPIASNFASRTECGGIVTTAEGLNVAGPVCAFSVYADATNDRAAVYGYVLFTTNTASSFIFSYKVI
jgi:hypothetical protein